MLALSLMELEEHVAAVCRSTRLAWQRLRTSPTEQRDRALHSMARALRAERQRILSANHEDVEAARGRGTGTALLDRLSLEEGRLEEVARAIEEIASLPDPLAGETTPLRRPNGLLVRRLRVPLGVIAMIYEARPNVTAEATALCVKAGNAVVLRGGSEAFRTNQAIAATLRSAMVDSDLPADAVQVLAVADREAVRVLVHQSDSLDLVIPRGGEALIRMVTEEARVPVVQHYKGVCHLFLDAGCDVDMAVRLAVNGKLSRPAVCNALECVLIDVHDVERLLPPVARALVDGGCELRGDVRTVELCKQARLASDADYGAEFLDRILAVRVVDGMDGALAHIARYGSGHTEAICTRSPANAARFRREVDAACVVVNASTRFHDGGELGLGAEIGIATSRLHWRGPMGLEALTTMQWLVEGEGQTRG